MPVHLQRRRTKPLPDLVCFHCQQAAEKYLKAFLILHEAAFPKTHDLVSLLELCVPFQPEIELLREPMELLNPYSVCFRYPGEESSKKMRGGQSKRRKR
ncbi:HEPN domain-containing protein [candidate division KSB1 bacterium]|nr:HEPN domain-containing protein [candidate division KSB1 bacterium]